MNRSAILAAGGTGGHVLPARTLAGALLSRGWRVDLITDQRGLAYLEGLSNASVHTLSVRAPLLQGGFGRLTAVLNMARSLVQALHLLRRLRPGLVMGFGGYPSLPTMLAAVLLRLPRALHEQNAVLGRANRLLARYVQVIATSFDHTLAIPSAARASVRVTGNPVRPEIAALREAVFPLPGDGGKLQVLVFGGSQGARLLSATVPEAIARLPASLRARLRIVQQCRPEDADDVRQRYNALAVEADVSTYFTDLPARLSNSQLVVSRAGAGTVSELAVAGRPAVLVPFAQATDNHQEANARALTENGGGWLVLESEFTAERLAALLQDLLPGAERLAAAAAGAAAVGRPEATERLVAIAESLAGPELQAAAA